MQALILTVQGHGISVSEGQSLPFRNDWMNLNEQTEFTWGQQFALCGCVIFVPVLEVVDLLHHDTLEYSFGHSPKPTEDSNSHLLQQISVFFIVLPFFFLFSAKYREWRQRSQQKRYCTYYFCNLKATDPVKIHVAIEPMVGQLKDGRDSQANVSGCLQMMLQQVGCLTSAVVDFEDHGQTKDERLLMSPLLCLIWRTGTEWPAFLTKAFVLVLSKYLQYVPHALT